DMELGQIQPNYIYHLEQYQKILKQRNYLLKQIRRQESMDFTMLDVLTEQLIHHATIILKKRFIFLEQLSSWAKDIHSQISRQLEHLSIQRSEEHTSELQSRFDLVCRLLLEKK